eukprot:1157764-Pelagomonas_calceolata.AAC.11
MAWRWVMEDRCKLRGMSEQAASPDKIRQRSTPMKHTFPVYCLWCCICAQHSRAVLSKHTSCLGAITANTPSSVPVHQLCPALPSRPF